MTPAIGSASAAAPRRPTAILGAALHARIARRLRRLQNLPWWARNARAIQVAQLRRNLRRAAATEFGREHDFARLAGLPDDGLLAAYRAAVPVADWYAFKGRIARMREGELAGSLLAWRDVLHEGPVPATDSLAQLTRVRASYLAEAGYGTELKIHDQLKARDAHLGCATEHDEVVLWFEHDLYDQLQLLQVLDWFAPNAPDAKISLIVVGRYPGIARFVGFGQLTPSQVAGLLDSRVPALPEHFDTARRAWAAFRQTTPQSWARLLTGATAVMPYLQAAVLRMLEELPSAHNGLSRSEQSALGLIADGAAAPHEIFAGVQALEDLQARLGQLDQLQERVSQLEERVDFTERLLARSQDRALPKGE